MSCLIHKLFVTGVSAFAFFISFFFQLLYYVLKLGFNIFFFTGPRVDFTLRRTKLPDEDLMKEACRKPKELKPIKKKNISTDALGNIHGRIHLGKQKIDKIQTRKMKGLKKTAAERKAEKAKLKQVLAVPNQVKQKG